MTDYWLHRAGSSGDLWNTWADKDIITIGWDVGDVTDDEPSWDEMKYTITEQYNPDDPGQGTGSVRWFTGIRSEDTESPFGIEPMAPGSSTRM